MRAGTKARAGQDKEGEQDTSLPRTNLCNEDSDIEHELRRWSREEYKGESGQVHGKVKDPRDTLERGAQLLVLAPGGSVRQCSNKGQQRSGR